MRGLKSIYYYRTISHIDSRRYEQAKKINTNTPTKLLNDFLMESKKQGARDTTMAIYSFPHGEGGIVFRMVVDSDQFATGSFLYRYTNKKNRLGKSLLANLTLTLICSQRQPKIQPPTEQ